MGRALSAKVLAIMALTRALPPVAVTAGRVRRRAPAAATGTALSARAPAIISLVKASPIRVSLFRRLLGTAAATASLVLTR
jgi:hypothetical protein